MYIISEQRCLIVSTTFFCLTNSRTCKWTCQNLPSPPRSTSAPVVITKKSGKCSQMLFSSFSSCFSNGEKNKPNKRSSKLRRCCGSSEGPEGNVNWFGHSCWNIHHFTLSCFHIQSQHSWICPGCLARISSFLASAGWQGQRRELYFTFWLQIQRGDLRAPASAYKNMGTNVLAGPAATGQWGWFKNRRGSI